MPHINAALIVDSDMFEMNISTENVEKRYTVHRALLAEKAKYFRTALEELDAGPGDFACLVENVAVDVFRPFIMWLYTGRVYLQDDEAFEPEKIELDVMDMEPDESWGETDGKRDMEKYPELEDVPFDEEADEEADEHAKQINDELNDSILPEPQDHSSFDHAVWDVWPHTKPADLDVYQLRVLLRLYEKTDNPSTEVKDHLQLMLQERENSRTERDTHAAFEPPAAAYDRLVDLYILANRLEAPELRELVMTLLQAEYEEQQAILGGRPLPSYEIVARVYEAIPQWSILHLWLLKTYMCDWKQAASMRVGNMEDMNVLPRDFVTRLLLALSEATFGQTVSDWAVDECPMR